MLVEGAVIRVEVAVSEENIGIHFLSATLFEDLITVSSSGNLVQGTRRRMPGSKQIPAKRKPTVV